MITNSHHSHHHHHHHQSPSHVKVQRSVSATTKPRRFSHGGDPNHPGAPTTTTGATAAAVATPGTISNAGQFATSAVPAIPNNSAGTSSGSAYKQRPSAFDHVLSKDAVIHQFKANNGDAASSSSASASAANASGDTLHKIARMCSHLHRSVCRSCHEADFSVIS